MHFKKACALAVTTLALLSCLACHNDSSGSVQIVSPREARLLPGSVTSVSIEATDVESFEDICQALAHREKLVELLINSTSVSARGFKTLKGFPALDRLDIEAAVGFDRACIQAISEVDSLRVVRLSEVPLKNEWLHTLIHKANMRELQIGASSHDDSRPRPTKELLQGIDLELLRCKRIVLDVSWIAGSGSGREILSRSDIRAFNERAGWELIVVGLV